MPPGPPPQTVPELPHTGAEVLGLAGVGGVTMLAGAGVVALARRRSGSGR
jgi:LPXTG-motif cell wall-anchored protein